MPKREREGGLRDYHAGCLPERSDSIEDTITDCETELAADLLRYLCSINAKTTPRTIPKEMRETHMTCK